MTNNYTPPLVCMQSVPRLLVLMSSSNKDLAKTATIAYMDLLIGELTYWDDTYDLDRYDPRYATLYYKYRRRWTNGEIDVTLRYAKKLGLLPPPK